MVMTHIKRINEFVNESRGARLINRTPDRFNSYPLANKKPNNVLDKQLEKRFDDTEKKLQKLCDYAWDGAAKVFDKYLKNREANNKLMVFPDGNGDYFKFVPKLEVANDDYKYEKGKEGMSVVATYKILMDVGGVIFNDGLDIINKVTDAVKNRYSRQMGLVLNQSNYDNDEDRLMAYGYRDNGENLGMFLIDANGLKLFDNAINQHNGGDYSNDDYEIKVTAREHRKYDNVVIEMNVVPTLENYDMANAIYQNLDDKNKNEQYAEALGAYIGEIIVDIFTRVSDEYEDVLR